MIQIQKRPIRSRERKFVKSKEIFIFKMFMNFISIPYFSNKIIDRLLEDFDDESSENNDDK